MSYHSLPPITLILGGASSGKSAYAERLVNVGNAGLYLATAEIRDEEMAERVRIHRERRSEIWTTLEEPLNIANILKEHASPERPVLVECLTVWTSNLMAAGRNMAEEVASLSKVLIDLDGPVIFVANEVGLGIVPDNKLARDFVNSAGQLNQSMAMLADRVVLVNAGLPTVIKEVEVQK